MRILLEKGKGVNCPRKHSIFDIYSFVWKCLTEPAQFLEVNQDTGQIS